jgi:hypothetical protein
MVVPDDDVHFGPEHTKTRRWEVHLSTRPYIGMRPKALNEYEVKGIKHMAYVGLLYFKQNLVEAAEIANLQPLPLLKSPTDTPMSTWCPVPIRVTSSLYYVPNTTDEKSRKTDHLGVRDISTNSTTNDSKTEQPCPPSLTMSLPPRTRSHLSESVCV